MPARRLLIVLLGLGAAAVLLARRRARSGAEPLAERSGGNGSRADRHESLRRFVEAGERHREQETSSELD